MSPKKPKLNSRFGKLSRMTQPKRSLSRFPHAKLFIYTYIDARQSYDLDPVAPQACTTVNQIPTHFLSFFFFDFFSLFSFLSFLLRRLSLTHAGTHINAHAHAKHKLTNTHMRASVTFGTDVQHTNNTHTRTHTHAHAHAHTHAHTHALVPASRPRTGPAPAISLPVTAASHAVND